MPLIRSRIGTIRRPATSFSVDAPLYPADSREVRIGAARQFFSDEVRPDTFMRDVYRWIAIKISPRNLGPASHLAFLENPICNYRPVDQWFDALT
jgi:hypothetical protein